MQTTLSSRGYSVQKDQLSEEKLKEIREELTVSPYVSSEYQTQRSFFKLYMESQSKIYLPKAYGLSKFGPATLNKLSKPTLLSENVKFEGTLREEQHKPVKCILDACRDEKRMGGILNVFCGGGKTTMALYILVELGVKTLIVVHKDFLLNQWKERIEQFIPNARIGLIKAKIVDIDDKDIVLASLQSLSMKDYEDNVFDGIAGLIVDECLPYEQKVATEQGPMKIGKLYNMWKNKQTLPKVLSYNSEKCIMEYKNITYGWKKTNPNLLEFNFGKLKLKCTPNHKILTPCGYKEAGTINVGDLISCNYRNDLEECVVAKNLNSDQYQILLGSFLGDGNVQTLPSNRHRLRIIHSIAQEEYCKWKASMFQVEGRRVEKNGYAQTSAFTFTTKIIDLPSEKYLPLKKNNCPQWILDDLDMRGLAIWWMDDGNLSKNDVCGSLSTCSFDEDTHIRMVSKLKSMGIESCYRSNGKGYLSIYINKHGIYALLKQIRKYMHPNMSYKFNNENLRKATFDYYDGSQDTIFGNIKQINPSLLSNNTDCIIKVQNGNRIIYYRWKNCKNCCQKTFHIKCDEKSYRCNHTVHNLPCTSFVPLEKTFTPYKWNNQFMESGTVKVQKISKGQSNNGTNDVFDIEVEDNHNFIACGTSGIGPIVHNCHHTSAEIFSQALKKVSFRYTIGLSATINRKDGLAKVFKWYLGDVVYKSTKRKDTVIVDVHEYFESDLAYSFEHKGYGGKLNVAKMINNICAYNPRISFTIDLVISILDKEPNRKILILSDRRSHLLTLFDKIKEIGIDVGIYMGGMDQKVLIECETKQVILATFSIAAEGYDQKGLDTLILASPKSDVVQSVGRILRDKECDRINTPLIIDIVDKFSIFEKQGLKRIKYYKSLGYTINGQIYNINEKVILEDGKCFIKDV